MSTKAKPQDKNKISEIDDQILKYFEIKKRLGKGAYGIVWKATDKKTNQVVAVKKIFDAFRNETDAQRTFREIMFLKAFRTHPSVIQLNGIYKAANNLDIYLSFEYMESDLHNVIKRGSILKDVHKRYIMYQLFNAIRYIHSGNVIHRDLKPSNVLIDSKCRCKIADFGLARSVSNRQLGEPNNNNEEQTEPILTDYVATRWYRAPEILVASKRYTKGIDMWSLGCILGEMIRGKPLFPGSSTVNQVERIVSALPQVTENDVAAVGAGFGAVLLNQQINSNNNPKLDDLLAGSAEDAKHLAKSLLILDPAGRLTANQALHHKFVEKFRYSIPEAELNSDVLPPFRDDVQLTVSEYRSKLYEVINANEKGYNGVKQSSKKKESTPNGKLENVVTVTPSATLVKRNSLSRPQDLERRFSTSSNLTEGTSSKRPEKKTVVFPQSNGGINSTSKVEANKSSNEYTFASIGNQNSTKGGEGRYRQIPKIKYCKITNFTETKNGAFAASEGFDDVKQKNLLNVSNCKSNNQTEKRHSFDCAFNSEYHSLNSNGPTPNVPGKSRSIYSSLSNLAHDRNGKTVAQTAENDTGYSSFTSKYSRPSHTSSNESHPRSLQKTAHSSEKPAAHHTSSLKASKSDYYGTPSDNSSSYYERRLKNLEEKIQRHKMDIKALFKHSSKDKLHRPDSIEEKKKIASSDFEAKYSKKKNGLVRSKSENVNASQSQNIDSHNCTAVKFDYTFSEGERYLNNAKRRGSAVTNEELFEIRKSQVIS